MYGVVQVMIILSARGWLNWGRITRQVVSSTGRKRGALQRWLGSLGVAHTLLPTPRIAPLPRLVLSPSNDTAALLVPRPLHTPSVGPTNMEFPYGMPWKSSIDPHYTYDEGLFFMPFWEWQIGFMTDHLSNLRLIPTVDQTKQRNDLTYVENSNKKKRMITLCFESDEYRLIRMTYLDAGLATQVFTSLFYPKANIPVLGIDFLQFNNQTRHLTVVDMQPIHPTENDHDIQYVSILEPIRNRYPSLQNRMSKKFYDENQFFSSQMLLGRGEAGPAYIWEELFPAYQSYVETHLSLVKNTLQESVKTEYSEVLRRHKAYDDYSSVRDPAHGLLKALFGKDYADSFVYDVLFPLSDEPGRKASLRDKNKGNSSS